MTPAVLMRHEVMGLLSAGLGVMFGIAFFRQSDVVFDKIQRSCLLRRRDMWRVTRTIIAFNQIDDVLVEQFFDSDSSDVISCRLSFATRDGTIPLSTGYEPDLGRFENMRSIITRTVFAGRSVPANPDPVRALIATGRLIDAVSLLRTREGLGLKQAREKIEMLRVELEGCRS